MTMAFWIGGAADAQEKPNSQVTRKYDRKKDLTTVRLKPLKVSPVIQQNQSENTIPLHQMVLDISYTFRGEDAKEPVDNVELRFQVSSRNYTFLKPQAAMAVVDNDASGKGRAFMLGNSDYKSYPPITNSVYEETLTVVAPLDALLKMAKASSLQIYLGPVGYDITGKRLDGIKELADSIPTTTGGSKSH